ncbi:hypothetical protein MEX01_54120 [Methylorubrum extorquens]|nr:hypothetical protein MEX01_54120 [Methylorubrum extorquens]
MTIYQWREIVDDKAKGIDDFIAYASFRTTKPNYWTYLIAILAAGGIGGAALNIALALVGSVPPLTEPRPAAVIWTNIYALILLIGLAVPVALWTLLARTWKR